MDCSNIKTNNSVDFKTTDKPYLIKKYAENWYAYKNWSFEYLKNLDSNLIVNTVGGIMQRP